MVKLFAASSVSTNYLQFEFNTTVVMRKGAIYVPHRSMIIYILSIVSLEKS